MRVIHLGEGGRSRRIAELGLQSGRGSGETRP